MEKNITRSSWVRVYILLLALCLCSLCGMAQQDLKTYVADINLPVGLVKITKEETLKLLGSTYKRTLFFRDYRNIYIANKIIVCLEDMYKANDDSLTLELHKKMTEDFDTRYGIKVIDSKILTVNNIKFFVLKCQDGDEIDLNFTPDFKNDATMLCTVKYKKEDESKAEKLFDILLNNFRYKN